MAAAGQPWHLGALQGLSGWQLEVSGDCQFLVPSLSPTVLPSQRALSWLFLSLGTLQLLGVRRPEEQLGKAIWLKRPGEPFKERVAVGQKRNYGS